MIIWVMYDIEVDKSRTQVAKYCKQAGLYRVKYSVFLGTLTENERDMGIVAPERLMCQCRILGGEVKISN